MAIDVESLDFESPADINAVLDVIGAARRVILRRRGWEQTSGNPGALILWRKTVGGVVYHCDQSTAMHIEDALDDAARPGDDIDDDE